MTREHAGTWYWEDEYNKAMKLVGELTHALRTKEQTIVLQSDLIEKQKAKINGLLQGIERGDV